MKIETPLILVTEANVQATTLTTYLAAQLGTPIGLINHPNQLLEIEGCNLFLIDLDYLKYSQQLSWNRHITTFELTNTVLLNAPASADLDLLLMWPNTSGLFFHQDPLDRLAAGLKKVVQGEYWLPRHLLSELTNYYRQGMVLAQTNQNLLTTRECEIIRCLMTGASNVEIASKLYVSEHTIKSHLYNVFKKLNVKNRLQAVIWAKEYLDITSSS